ADCEVPVENRLGGEGEGFRVALGALDHSRPAVGAQAVGIAQAALDAAVAYAKERSQFGQPIAAFQGIQFMLADMAMAVHASRLMVHHAAALVDRGATATSMESSMAKCFAGGARRGGRPAIAQNTTINPNVSPNIGVGVSLSVGVDTNTNASGQSNAPDTQSPGASPSGSATGSGSVSTDTNTQTPSASPRLGDDKVKPDDKDRERMKDQEKIDRKTGR